MGRRTGALLATVALGLLAGCLPTPLPRPVDPQLRQWMVDTSVLRALPFRTPVRLEWIEQDRIPEVTRYEIERTLSSDHVAEYRDAYAALGVLPPEIDLLETLVALQRDQLVGLYSLHRRTLYVVTSERTDGAYAPNVIVVHELVHALQHQHFPKTVAILQGLRHNDDVASAIAAVIEGDASYTMLATPGASEFERTSAQAALLRDAMLVDLEHPTGLLAEVPRLLRVALIFPYAYGAVVAAERFAEGGNAGLDGLLANPPLSAQQIRYPDDGDPIEFLKLPLARLEGRLAARGCSIRHHNVAGVATIEVLLEDYAAGDDLDPLLRRWSGDRFLHVVCAGRSELAWLTRWKDVSAAREFAMRYAGIAPDIARAARLSGPPQVVLEGRSALVLSPGLDDLAALITGEVEVRAYDSVRAWTADGCFTEGSCPVVTSGD